MCSMYSSPGTTDKSLSGRARNQGVANPNHVLSLDGAGIPSKTVALAYAGNYPTSAVRVKKAIPGRPDLDLGANVSASLVAPATTIVNEYAAPRTRVEIVPGSYMYLTASEAADLRAQNYIADQEESTAAAQVQSAKSEIARLQARIAELSIAV
jgi:hypothetical protein